MVRDDMIRILTGDGQIHWARATPGAIFAVKDCTRRAVSHWAISTENPVTCKKCLEIAQAELEE